MSSQPGGNVDFGARLRSALNQSKGQTPRTATTTTVPAATEPPSDEFNDRLASALSQARGEEPAEQTVDQPESTGPVGQGDHVVGAGDCIHSISFETGFFWETLWDEPANEELKRIRKNPAVLLEGDRVTVPAKRRKDESCTPEKRHRFRRKGCPKILKIQFTFLERPVANEEYVLDIDGHESTGSTDAGGWLIHGIPPDARQATLTLQGNTYTLNLGHLAPVEEMTGVQARLQTLGLYLGAINGDSSSETVEAIKQFQESQGLTASGEPDEPTRRKLVERVGD